MNRPKCGKSVGIAKANTPNLEEELSEVLWQEWARIFCFGETHNKKMPYLSKAALAFLREKGLIK